MTITSDESPCTICGHARGPHVFATTGADKLDGGIAVCPEPDCQCFFTWDITLPGEPKRPLRIPDQDEIDHIRAAAQAGLLQ